LYAGPNARGWGEWAVLADNQKRKLKKFLTGKGKPIETRTIEGTKTRESKEIQGRENGLKKRTKYYNSTNKAGNQHYEVSEGTWRSGSGGASQRDEQKNMLRDGTPHGG